MPDAYAPELGQLCWGNPWGGFDVGNLGRACVEAVIGEVERVFWNVHQLRCAAMGTVTIGGVTLRPYWWGDEDDPHAAMPNLELHHYEPAVEIRWYKHPGRGTTVNREMSPADWAKWLDACITALAAADKERADA